LLFFKGEKVCYVKFMLNIFTLDFLSKNEYNNIMNNIDEKMFEVGCEGLPSLDIERALGSLGYTCVCGADEAGRGPLIGRVYAAAVVLPSKFLSMVEHGCASGCAGASGLGDSSGASDSSESSNLGKVAEKTSYIQALTRDEWVAISRLNDSKKLTEKRREAMFESIKKVAVAYGIAYAEASEIDEMNILNASMLAMKRAIEQLEPAADFALIDGNRVPKNLAIPARAVVKGDAKCLSIAAASVLAKVARDRYMVELDAKYPQYGLAKHKGYPTKAHYEAIAEFGATPEHRKSFRLT
jgi:ribonuclease HII